MVVAAGRCRRSRSIGDLPVLDLGMADSFPNCASSDAGEAPNSCTTRCARRDRCLDEQA